MRPIVTDRVVWSVGLSVGLSVGQSVTLVSPAKTAELIEMPSRLRTRVGPGNHLLDGWRYRSPRGRGNCWGKGRPLYVKYGVFLQ